MNAVHDAALHGMPLVEIIDLKWLLGAAGVRLHVERLRSDPVYAAEVLALAEASGNDALRDAAVRIREHLRRHPVAG
jgi:hypothetical protein